MIEDADYATDPARLQRRDEVVSIIEDWLQTQPDVAGAIAALEANGVPCAPVLSVEETVNHPHFVERGTVRTVVDPLAGEFQMPGMLVKTSGFAANQP